ncbi:hypothetical protein D9Q98_005455 [Chlorella vulgaris]|uniref:Uncharacterized protein n=1 Tax=Chlorella vulgaris TaxID=3077 RepID=A0A9D4TMR3_CHLVU|nr:hypothetical protein D9Q98_005455 [Chlorella vulgaris]
MRSRCNTVSATAVSAGRPLAPAPPLRIPACWHCSAATARKAAWSAGGGLQDSRSVRQRHRAAGTGLRHLVTTAGDLPVVSWHHYQCLQLLFIDRSDTVRARFALGMFETISAHNGCSRSLAGTPCGVEASLGSSAELGTQAGLFGLASSWGLRPHLFTSPRLTFEPDDIDRFDLLICLDSSIQAAVLQAVSLDRPDEPGAYVQRVCCLSDFLYYCSDEALTSSGSASVFDRRLRSQVALALPALRPSAARVAAAAAAAAGTSPATASSSSSIIGGAPHASVPSYMLPTGIPRPPLGGGGDNSGSADEQWERMAMLTAVCTAGLVRYLLDCGPEEPDSGYSTDE